MASTSRLRSISPTSATTTTTTATMTTGPEFLASRSSSSSSLPMFTPRPPTTPPPPHLRAAMEKQRREKIMGSIIVSLVLLAGIIALVYIAVNASSSSTPSSSSTTKPVSSPKAVTEVATPSYAPLDDADVNAPWNAYHNGGALADANSAWFAYSTPASDELLWQRYVAWHSAQLHYHATCGTTTEFIVWSGNAGFGDSAFALVAAMRLAVTTGRMLMVEWPTVTPSLTWPDIQWSWRYFINRHPTRCGLSASELQGAGRVHMLQGHIWSGHPLAKVNAPYGHQSFRSDSFLLRKLIRPTAAIMVNVDATITKLRGSSSDTPNSIIGVQMRTGVADLSPSVPTSVSNVPDYAQFLNIGDEEKFVAHVHTLLTKEFNIPTEQHRLVITPATPTPSTDTKKKDVRIFVMTDSDAARRVMTQEFGDRIMYTDGPVMHTGVSRTHSHTQSADGLHKALVDWMVFTHADYAITTAWSLFGASALEYAALSYDRVIQVDNSHCGQPGRKPCRNE